MTGRPPFRPSRAIARGAGETGVFRRRARTGILTRREAVAAGFALPIVLATPAFAATESPEMYGLIGKMIAQPGKRDELIAILLEGSDAMPGCLSYVVAKDLKDPNAIWVNEVWDSKESHAGALKLPGVQTAIARGRPMITGFDSYTETRPVGGVGLKR